MQIKDSLTNKKLIITDDFVSIYACGITPYSEAHVGHARTYIVFDLLKNVLVKSGKKVRLVRNITDIDDKIIKKAQELNRSWKSVSDQFSNLNTALMADTGLSPIEQPKASEYLPSIFKLIQALLNKNLAYISSAGDVLYRVSSYSGNVLMLHEKGALKSEQGASRVQDSDKEDSRDFALWKRTAEPGFDSPWGFGRPGWHIECSAMINELFEGSVTIHGGGVDLKFPHHQAEIMQSEPINGKPLAKVWMHNGSVMVNGQKMSKSLNNFVTWRALLEESSKIVGPELAGDLFRVSMLQTHWQKPMDWNSRVLRVGLDRLEQILKGAPTMEGSFLHQNSTALAVLADNLNTPGFFVWLTQQAKAGAWESVFAGLELLNVDRSKWIDYFNKRKSIDYSEEILNKLIAKEMARTVKNWAVADSLRQELLTLHGISLDKQVLPATLDPQSINLEGLSQLLNVDSAFVIQLLPKVLQS